MQIIDDFKKLDPHDLPKFVQLIIEMIDTFTDILKEVEP